MKTFWYPLNGAERVLSNKIDQFIPLYPVEIMKVGDWFHVPADRDQMPKHVRPRCRRLAERHEMKLKFEIVDQGTKVTRIA